MKSHIVHMLQAQCQVHHLVQLFVIDAEFVLGQAGGDAGVRVRADVRIDAQGHGGHLPHLARQGVDDLQLGRGLHVETGNAGLQREADLLVALAHTCEDDALRGEARVQRRLHLATAHTVGAEAPRSDLRENTGVVIRLDRIVHPEVRIAVQLLPHEVKRAAQQGQVVIVERGPQARKAFYREITLQHYLNRHLLKERRARALSSPFTRKEML